MIHGSMRRALALGLLALPLLAGACGGDGTGPGDGIEGAYTLESVNDGAVPVIVYSDSVDGYDLKFRVRSGRLSLTDDRYQVRLVMETLINDVAFSTDTIPDAGRYSVSGHAVTLTSDDAEVGTIAATIDGERLTAEQDDPEFGRIKLVYRK